MADMVPDFIKALLGTGAAANAGDTTQLRQLYSQENVRRQMEGQAPLPPFEEWARQYGMMNASNPYQPQR